MPQHTRQTFLDAQVGQPVPGQQTRSGDHEILAHLTALLPRAGIPDVAPLLAITHELGEWMQHAVEPPPS